MANPTTNYGFVLPTSSDLVTDLPADFDVALQGVDTRLKALQPGTTLGDLAYSSATANTNTRLAVGSTGQVLTVAAGVPAWATPSSSMTNPMTTTGDIIYSSSGSTPARLGIGSTGQVLSVSSGVPAWTSPGGYVQVATGSTTSGTSLNLTSLTTYNNYILVHTGISCGVSNDDLFIRFNNDSSAIYDTVGTYANNQSNVSINSTKTLNNFGVLFSSISARPLANSFNSSVLKSLSLISPVSTL